jgi:uncharacterized integral membrane protein (TIGR00698 family)
MTKNRIARYLIPVVAVLVLFPAVTAAMALVAGVLIAVFLENPYPTKNYTHKLLTWSVIGLGAGMNLETVARVGAEGIGYTLISLTLVFIVGWCLRKLLSVDSEVGLLITVGTAICGGSAIAAVTPVIRAKPHSVSVALGSIFILNALALIVFPPIGHFFSMSERAFGLWSALAIHDTSSVVGATVAYGKIAAEVGTTVKLARALWIVPVTLIIGQLTKTNADGERGKAKKPWFILGFVVAAALVTWVPALQVPGHWVEAIAKRCLVLTLFLIGLGLSKETLKTVGPRPLILAVVLWLVVSVAAFSAVQAGWIH